MTTIILCVVWVAAVVFLAVSGVIAFRRKLPPETFRGSEGAGTAVVGILGTFFAVLIGFTVIMVWDHYTDASSAIHLEAGHLADLWQLAQGLDPGDQERIRTPLIAYISTVIRDEWPAMARGHDDGRAWEAMAAVWTTYRSVNATEPARQAIYAESISHLSQISDARRVRLHALHDDVPGLMWIALIVGGVVVVMSTYFFVPEKLAVHAALVGGVSALITLNLFLIYALDNPFRGWPRLGPEFLQQELARIENTVPKENR